MEAAHIMLFTKNVCRWAPVHCGCYIFTQSQIGK